MWLLLKKEIKKNLKSYRNFWVWVWRDRFAFFGWKSEVLELLRGSLPPLLIQLSSTQISPTTFVYQKVMPFYLWTHFSTSEKWSSFYHNAAENWWPLTFQRLGTFLKFKYEKIIQHQTYLVLRCKYLFSQIVLTRVDLNPCLFWI